MSEILTFKQAKRKYFKTLEQYVPIVARVHGAHHPEFHDVRAQFDALVQKTREAGTETPDLREEFTRIREISNNYEVPDDVCETYEAVYHMLSELDKAYHA